MGRGAHRRPDRHDMTTILVTAAGAPGAAALLRGLRENGEREVRLVGVDMSERSIGRHLCDAFHLVPPGSDPGYADAILELVEREGAEIVLPQSSFDLPGLASARGRFPVPVLVSASETVQRSNDKAETYSLLQRIGVPTIEFRRVAGARAVEAAARELGYPDRPVCFKPVFSSGSRGFRILDPTVDRAHQLLHERPGIGVDAARGSARPAAGAGRHRAARHGARHRRRAHDRRHRRRRAHRARASEDARVDARRPRDVLRHARGRRADGARRPHRARSSRSSGSSTSSSSAIT